MRIKVKEALVYLREQAEEFSDSDVLDDQPCPECRGRADDDCITCGGMGYV